MNGFSEAAGNQELKTGANDEIRTRDLLITNQLLYQLSYIGTAAWGFTPKGVLHFPFFAQKRKRILPSAARFQAVATIAARWFLIRRPRIRAVFRPRDERFSPSHRKSG